MRRVICVGAVLAAAVFIPGAARAGDPSAGDLIEQCRTYLAHYGTCAYKAAVTTRYYGPRMPPGTVESEKTYSVWHDGPRWRYVTRRTNTYPDKSGKLESEKGGTEWVNQERGAVAVSLDESQSRGAGVIARLGELTEADRNAIAALPVSVLHGVVPESGFVSLADLLREASPRVERDGPLWVVRGVNRWGQIAVWFDPARGGAWTRIEQIKRADDWYAPDKKLGSCPSGGLYRPKSTYSRVTRRVSLEKWGHANGIPFPEAFTLDTEELYANNQSVRFVDTVTVTDMRFGPEVVPASVFAIGTDIADGTPVTVEDSPNIDYEWRGGKIVKKIDGAVVADLEGWEFTPEGRGRRWWVIALWVGAGLVACAGVVYLTRVARHRATQGHGGSGS